MNKTKLYKKARLNDFITNKWPKVSFLVPDRLKPRFSVGGADSFDNFQQIVQSFGLLPYEFEPNSKMEIFL